MEKNKNKKTLEMLSRNLEHFFPGLKDYFMCPTCLKKIPLKNSKEITIAHIVPKAANGRLKTYLCKQCNSSFGARQDKWFGEYIRIANDSRSTVFSTAIQDGYYYLDGQRVNGFWRVEGEKNFSFYIDDRRNSPEVIKWMDQKFLGTPPKIELKVPIPILRNDKYIKIGFLTAGYLKWFSLFGYSWVLQKHLSPIREQICNPDKEIITGNYHAEININTESPWIAFIPIKNRPLPAFGYLKHIIIYPPRYEPDLYNKITSLKEDFDIKRVRQFHFTNKPIYGEPLFILQDQHIMIAPELMEKKEQPVCLQFKADEDKPRILHPINDKDFDSLSKKPNTIVHHIKL